jgi:hypothetical protein
VTRHRFINAGVNPIPMGATAEYACICGRRGPWAVIAKHIAESSIAEEDAAIVEGDDFSENTKAHYLPVEPREPAPYSDDDTPVPPPPPRARESDAPTIPPPLRLRNNMCPICRSGTQIADLPEIAAWTCGHWTRKKLQPIAESFQDMLRIAFQAGLAAAKNDETFEVWYQREVLQGD